MKKIRDLIPKTYMPLLFGVIIIALFSFFTLIVAIYQNEFLVGLKEIKSLNEPDKYLQKDTLIIDEKYCIGKAGGQTCDLLCNGHLKSNTKIKRKVIIYGINEQDIFNNNPTTGIQLMFECTGCKHGKMYPCECLPILRSNLHNKIYLNFEPILKAQMGSVYINLIMETYLFWIVPFLFLYWKLTQFLYSYLDQKIKENEKNA